MAEIKLNDGFAAEVDAFRAPGAEFNTVSINSISAGGLSLPTVEAYQNRLFEIWKLMVKFEVLTNKDAKDMDALAASLKAADAAG